MAAGLPNTQGYGHSTVGIAIQAAQVSGARQLVLFHHAPEYDDEQMDRIAAQADRLLPGTMVAREGLTLHLYQTGGAVQVTHTITAHAR